MICSKRLYEIPPVNCKSLVEAFAAEDNPAESGSDSLIDQIIFQWTGADSVASDARGPVHGRTLKSLHLNSFMDKK